jgi:regulator of nonsense transcripts 1
VDQLTDRIHSTGLKVVRLCARSRESLSSNVDFISLHQQIKHLKHNQFKRMQELMVQRDEDGELNEKDDKTFKDLKRQAEDEIIRNADVICTTCVSAFDQRLKSIKFK